MIASHPPAASPAASHGPGASGRALRFAALVVGLWLLVRLAIVAAESPAPAQLTLAQSNAEQVQRVVAAQSATGLDLASEPGPDPEAARGMPPAVQTPMPGAAHTHGPAAMLAFAKADLAAPVSDGGSLLAGPPAAGWWRTARIAAYRSLGEEAGLLARMARIAPAAPWQGQSGAALLAPAGMADMRAPALAAPAAPARRWAADGWLLWRDSTGGRSAAGLAPVPQLGGAQAGVRLGYALGDNGSTSLYGRLSRPLAGRNGAEAALGVSWKPGRAIPVALAVERRIAVERGGRNAVAAYVAGGFGPQPIAPSPVGPLEAEAYVQAGIVGAKRRDAFADGMIRLGAPIVTTPQLRLTGGTALWAAAQPGARRIDIGPQLQLSAEPDRAMRLSVDWRARVDGNAQPASGLALTLSARF